MYALKPKPYTSHVLESNRNCTKLAWQRKLLRTLRLEQFMTCTSHMQQVAPYQAVEVKT